MKQPTLDFVPIGVFHEPPPDDSNGNIGGVFLGSDDDTVVAGVNVGRAAYRLTRAEAELRRLFDAVF